jgi:hypothetical protein
MLSVGTLTETQSTDIFKNSDSIKITPVVSAEWNHNLFNPPYITTAGVGTKISGTLTSGTVSDVTSGAKENFTTKSFAMSSGTGSVEYTVSGLSGVAYKIVTYVKTNSPMPVMISSYAKGSDSQFGSEQVEASSLGWTKVVTYIGGSKASDTLSSFVYKIVANRFAEETENPVVSFTVPEIYETTFFDYKNGSLFPTDSAFTYFRPGESYVSSGDSKCSFGLRYRRIASKALSTETATTISGKDFFGNKYMPITPIIQNPSFFLSSPPVAVLKNALPTDINPYRYFVSDSSSKSITAIYEKNIVTNKIVIKVNTLMTVPTLNIYVNGSLITVDSSTSITPTANADGYINGLITLYWTGSAWSKTPWTTMPQFDSVGALTLTTTINKIRVTQISRSINAAFSSYSGDSVTNDLNRMHVIEISPRLEVDLSDFVQDITVNKSLDSNKTALPISSINANDAKITFSGIPSIKNGAIVPIFSSQSDNSLTVLSNMLRKNVKFYVNFNLRDHVVSGTTPTVETNKYIPAGIFYSDSWEENDIREVSVQSYDISRYLQSRPVPDYVANLKTVFEVITNILDLAGFTDYDYDSLYKICNNKAQPLDISYYYCNSKDTTLVDALNQMFVAYQIGAYIDEYGVMKFLGLYDILTSNSAGLTISEAHIDQGGLSVSNTEKPGKVSLRYQTPKVKQSPALQNVKDLDIKNSPAFIYTTSNDVVWQQQTVDSVGFNYIDENMTENSNTLNINSNDLLDIFHTFNMDTNGYVAVEKEIMSFEYKQYTISNKSKTKSVTVSIKNNLELSSQINKFIKEHTIGLQTSDGSSGQNYDYDILVEPTGNITNVQRGMFGTVPSAHTRITSLASKGLSEKNINSSFVFSSSSGNTLITNNHDDTDNLKLPNVTKLGLRATGTNKTAVCPSTETTNSYKTYSVKFDIPNQNVAAAGLYINHSSTGSPKPLFVELIKYSKYKPGTQAFFEPPVYNYMMAIYDSSDMYAYTDVTGECNNILKTLPKVLQLDANAAAGEPQYNYVTDEMFNLRVVLNSTDGSDGENGTVLNPNTALCVYLNNTEIIGWQVPDTTSSVADWNPTDINTTTGIRQKPTVPDLYTESKSFGFYASVSPKSLPGITYPTPLNFVYSVANLREIHATEKPLFERSAGYFYQDREFLNGLIQKQPLYSNSNTYMMQTTPEISGINYYDVQYSTPAAVSVDVFPIQYMMSYFPGNTKEQQQYKQKKLVTEDSLSYSTPLNTGFRARMAIANSSPHMVLLTKESDEVVRVTINLNLWTHEIVAPSDPEILEAILDPSNISEVVQLDSQWIQSKSAATKMLKIVEMGIDGFSTTTTLNIFGNPLIQVGDFVTLSYNLNGILSQRNIVTSVSHNFNSGLSTTITLKRLN